MSTRSSAWQYYRRHRYSRTSGTAEGGWFARLRCRPGRRRQLRLVSFLHHTNACLPHSFHGVGIALITPQFNNGCFHHLKVIIVVMDVLNMSPPPVSPVTTTHKMSTHLPHQFSLPLPQRKLKKPTIQSPPIKIQTCYSLPGSGKENNVVVKWWCYGEG